MTTVVAIKLRKSEITFARNAILIRIKPSTSMVPKRLCWWPRTVQFSLLSLYQNSCPLSGRTWDLCLVTLKSCDGHSQSNELLHVDFEVNRLNFDYQRVVRFRAKARIKTNFLLGNDPNFKHLILQCQPRCYVFCSINLLQFLVTNGRDTSSN